MAIDVKMATRYFLYSYAIASLLNECAGVKKVSGTSMRPTLEPNDVILTRKVFGDFKRNTIYVFQSPESVGSFLIKRVVALEGDKVQYKDENGEFHTLDVPRGHCWIEGDNNPCSKDSRAFGPISASLVDKQASLIIWPFAKIGFVQ
ncbi:LexA/Signal peptidase [Rozella allomycis CSF55]|uniref:Mitochondrial inner membrane protease subunit n=1 Tax=Rozella allomycis (strain CSF55) TaxID=988480 RepID=A0A4P9YG17_ROZAC|nr:LexA/Signal peptidase [Rozella allomycis CSF55]